QYDEQDSRPRKATPDEDGQAHASDACEKPGNCSKRSSRIPRTPLAWAFRFGLKTGSTWLPSSQRERCACVPSFFASARSLSARALATRASVAKSSQPNADGDPPAMLIW